MLSGIMPWPEPMLTRVSPYGITPTYVVEVYMYLYSVDITLVVMYFNVEIFRVMKYFTWSALNNYLITERMVIIFFF